MAEAELRLALARAQDELELVEELYRLNGCESFEQACQRFLQLARRLVGCRSAVLWSDKDFHLVAASDSGWDEVELTHRSVLLELRERRRPWTGDTALLRPEETDWILEPVSRWVLYLGWDGCRRGDPYFEKLIRFGALALENAWRKSELASVLARLEEERREQAARAHSLERVVELGRRMAEQADLAEALYEGLRELYGTASVKLAGRWRGEPEGDMADLALRSGRGVLLEDGMGVTLADGDALVVRSAGLERHDLQLLELVAEQAAALAELRATQAGMAQAGKMAAVGQLAAGLAHELNTPLASVLLSLESAERALPPNAEKVLKKLGNAANTLLKAQALVEKLLFYSRPTSGARRSVELNSVVHDTMELLEHTLALRRIRVDLELADGLPMVSGNAQELQQVVTNLVMNAADASRAPGSVRIATYAKGDWVVVEVRDWGEGMEAEVQARLFEPFFTTKEPGQGTGLGLAVCEQLVRAHQGRLLFKSHLGEGTTFFMELPAEVV